jgi:CelD/BcsL family acetyltransferase involved in cellulose biosynthesis
VTEVLAPSALSTESLGVWRDLQRNHPEFERPFFSPEYFRILEEVGRPVRIARLEHADGSPGFFPFEVHGTTARPAGGPLSDFQGVIAPVGRSFEPRALLRGCGLSAWHFDHLLITEPGVEVERCAGADSPYADLADGFEAYLDGRRAAGSGWVRQVPRKGRKMGRELGELRFEYDCRDRDVFAQLRAWKAAQREQTHTVDPLELDWASEAMDRFLDAREPEFSGVLSALYAGQTLVAAHFGLRSRRTLHIWFPAYDPQWEAYSPGMVLFLEMFRAAADEGVTRIDFGKGPARYKSSMMTDRARVAEGCVDLRPFGRLVSGTWYTARRWARESSLRSVIQGPKRRLRRWLFRMRLG